MEYQVSDFISEERLQRRERDKKMAKEFFDIQAQLNEDGFDYGFLCRVYQGIARRYGVSEWTVMRAVRANSKQLTKRLN